MAPRTTAVLVGLLGIVACGQRGLTNQQLGQAIASQKASLDACYQETLSETGKALALSGRALIIVEKTGEVSSVAVEVPKAPEPLTRCLHDAIRKFRFPEATARSQPSLPLVFEPEIQQAPAAVME